MRQTDQFYSGLLSKVLNEKGAAYRHKEIKINYPEFVHLATRIHSRFGGSKGIPIVTIFGKDVKCYAAVLAIILSGNTWVPLSISSPNARNIDVFKNFKQALVIVDHDVDHSLATLENMNGFEFIDLRTVSADDPPLAFDPIGFDPEANAMIYFTSGSTGEPKGVQISHRNFISMLDNIMNLLPWPQNGVFADLHELSFVISIPILFPCWLTGGTVAPAMSQEERFLPVDYLLDNEVDVLITVPSTVLRVKTIMSKGIKKLDLKLLINCGEPLHLDVLDYSLKLAKKGEVYNFYGSTEVAPWTFFHHCRQSDVESFDEMGYAPIGTLLPGNEMKLDPQTSELLISGPQLTAGYLGHRDEDKFESIDGIRWYRTGDKVVKFKRVYFCKGRLDSQIKLAGYRIEILDIEAHLRTLSKVKSAICFVDTTLGQGKVIVAILESDANFELMEIREHLKERLPDYMIPRKVYVTQNFPLNRSGKIDRLALKTIYSNNTNAPM